MNKREEFILSELKKLYPNPKTELKNWKSEFQFLVCIMLSAQTTDIQVNKVTDKLFEKYPDVSSFASAEVDDVKNLLKSLNFYKNKSKHIIEMSKILIRDFNSKVPSSSEELIKLPGVGKKTANVFLNELFQANEGIAVDTHVARVAQRLELSGNPEPYKISLDLEKLYLKKDWYLINSTFVLFGRYICKAKGPLCLDCPLNNVCKIGMCKKKNPQV